MKTYRIKNFFAKVGIAIVQSVVKVIITSVHVITTAPIVKLYVGVFAVFSLPSINAQYNITNSTADNGGNFTSNLNVTGNGNFTNSLSCVNNATFMDRNYAYMADPRELTAYGDYLPLYGEGFICQYEEGFSDALVGGIGDNNDPQFPQPWAGCWNYYGTYDYTTNSDFRAPFESLNNSFCSNATGNPVQEAEANSRFPLRFRISQFNRTIVQEGNETHSQIEEVNRVIYTHSIIQWIRTTLELFPPNSDGSNGSHIESAYIDPDTNEITNVVTEERSPGPFRQIPLNDTAMVVEATLGADNLCGLRLTRSGC